MTEPKWKQCQGCPHKKPPIQIFKHRNLQLCSDCTIRVEQILEEKLMQIENPKYSDTILISILQARGWGRYTREY